MIREHRLEAIGVVVCAALLALHFCGSEDSAQPAPNTPGTTAPPRAAAGGEELDAKLWEEWRAQREPSVVDSRDDRRDKEFSNAMKSFRQQPVEVLDDESEVPGVVVIDDVTELRALLASGGSYSGPLPPELVEPSEEPPSAPAAGTSPGGGK